MAEEFSNLRIKAERLGSVREINQLLSAIENAYNHLYAFEYIVDSLIQNQELQFRLNDDRYHRWRKMWKEFSNRKDYPFDPFFYEMIYEDFLFRLPYTPKVNLLELKNNIIFDEIILPHNRLQLTRVNVQSPGFWEFLGSLNPLQQLREYLKDRHERQKDTNYRNRQEEEKGDLDNILKKEGIINQRIDMLHKLGYNETEIRQFVFPMIVQPLNLVGRQQDNGLIETPEEIANNKSAT